MSIASSDAPAKGGVPVRQHNAAATRRDGACTSMRAPARIVARAAAIPVAIGAAEKRDE